MEERPKIFITAQNDMSTTSAIAAIRAGLRIELRAHKMPATCTTVPASAKYSYVINEIRLLHPAAI
jgi:hypothetical protein